MDWFVVDLQDPASYRLNKLEDVFIDSHENTNQSIKVIKKQHQKLRRWNKKSKHEVTTLTTEKRETQ